MTKMATVGPGAGGRTVGPGMTGVGAGATGRLSLHRGGVRGDGTGLAKAAGTGPALMMN